MPDFNCTLSSVVERADDCDPIRRIADRWCNSTDLGRGGTTAGEAPCHHGGTGRRQPAHTARPVCRLGRLYRPTGGKVCFALSKPISAKTEPAGRKREPAYIFVATRPAENVKNELSVIIGYPFKSTSDATAEIGTAKFAMYTKNGGAWIKNAADEARIIEAMRKGADLTIKGTSGGSMQSTDRVFAQGPPSGTSPSGAGVQVSNTPPTAHRTDCSSRQP